MGRFDCICYCEKTEEKHETSIQGLKDPLGRGPGPAICGFGPAFSNPVKTDGPVETVQLWP
jgi:hypothetical protein